ncbi:MAG: galactose mutarotase-like enzyme [Bacteroidia bacterium]
MVLDGRCRWWRGFIINLQWAFEDVRIFKFQFKMQLKNEYIQVEISTLGAELQSIKSISTNKEYLWQADPEVWPRHAPLLFPIVGRLKEDTYKIGDESHSLGQHGFARSLEFDVVKWNPTEIIFSLKSSPETFQSYPYHFDFRVGYKLEGNAMIQSFEVINTDDQTIPFSFGAHPAFIADPIDAHYIEFEHEESQQSVIIDDGIRTNNTKPVFDKNRIQLTQSIFDEDALIFSNLNSKSVTLRTSNNERLVEVRFEGFPFLGIWAKPKANYVCIEPWCGIADHKDHNQNIFEKEGIMVLEPQGRKKCQIVLSF